MLFSPSIHRYIFILGLALSLCALPFSPFALTVGLIILTANWLIDGAWTDKYNRFINRKSLWSFLLIYIAIAVGSIYSSNTGYAIKELKLWLPLILVPIVLSTSASITKGEFKLLLILFCTAVFAATLISFSIYIRDYSYLGQNVRYLSPFISHIRFALMVNLSILLLFYLAFQRGYFVSMIVKITLNLIAAWFVVYLFILQSVTGIVLLIMISALLIVRWTISLKEPVLKFTLIVALSFSFLFSFSYLAHTVDKFFTRNSIDYTTLPKETFNGNQYIHDTLNRQFENGNPVWINVCYPELIRGWERASSLFPKAINKNYWEVEPSLIRYLTSKGLKKDSVGFSKLDTVDIRLINSHVSSVIFREHKAGIYPRLYQLLWEIDNYSTLGVIGGSTLMQRVIYLKASWQIIKKNFFFGVGTGDGKDTLMEYYKTSKIKLDPKYWFLSHNQYLTVWIGIGFFGLILFLFGFLFPIYYEKHFTSIPCITFLSIVLLSMLTEDTLETHIGISFVAIFYSLFIFGYDFKKEIDE